MKKKIVSLLSVMICVNLSACSVYMASQKKGANVDELQACQTRTCLMNKGAVVVSQKANKEGTLTQETFQVQKPTGSTARAVMHGGLDVATLGVWEMAGTPIEGVLNKPEKYGIKVNYKNDGETIKSIQLA